MVAYSTVSGSSPEPQLSGVACPAKALGPAERQDLAIRVLAGTETISRLAGEFDVSRKFISQQAVKAEDALQGAFYPAKPAEDAVLFYLPVTKPFVEQLVLGLALDCHSSVRGVVTLLGDVFDWHISVGTVDGILQKAMLRARSLNAQQDLSGVMVETRIDRADALRFLQRRDRLLALLHLVFALRASLKFGCDQNYSGER